MRKRLEKLQTNSYLPTDNNDDKTSGKDRAQTMIFPFSDRLSMKLKRLLNKFNINIVSKVANKLANLIGSTKDPIDKKYKSNIIYQIDCANCNKTYIGQTSQYLKDRIYQHNYSIEKEFSNGRTELTKHALEEKHKFNFDKAKILDTESHKIKREFIEMYHIKKHLNNCVNAKTDIKNLPWSYNHFIENY